MRTNYEYRKGARTAGANCTTATRSLGLAVIVDTGSSLEWLPLRRLENTRRGREMLKRFYLKLVVIGGLRSRV